MHLKAHGLPGLFKDMPFRTKLPKSEVIFADKLNILVSFPFALLPPLLAGDLSINGLLDGFYLVLNP